MAEKFIQKAIKHPGALHKQLGVPQDKKIPAKKLEAAAHKKGKLGQRARFAQTLKKLYEEDAMQEAFSPADVAKRSLAVKRELDAAARSKAAKSMLDKAAAAKKARLQEDFAPISDAITLVANQQYADASSVINDVLGGRVLSALEAHKQVVAKSLFAPSADALSEEVVEEGLGGMHASPAGVSGKPAVVKKKKVSTQGLKGMFAPGKYTKKK